jgi:hypothetical protein
MLHEPEGGGVALFGSSPRDCVECLDQPPPLALQFFLAGFQLGQCRHPSLEPCD